MMVTRISEIVSQLLRENIDLSSTTFILPSKRAGSFLRKEILEQIQNTIFSPAILSIEELIEKIADIKIGDSTILLFEFYKVYLENPSIKEKESFESFSAWATVLLDDFNEIDRNLINRDSFFSYLQSIQEIEHWYLKEEKSEMILNYISFWDSLSALYAQLAESTTKQGIAHQGLVYREAANNIEHYLQAQSNTRHLFIGFNALNEAEELIIKEILENGNSEIYWDADSYFMENENHSASHFLRKFQKTWKYFKNHEFKHVSESYSTQKDITIIGSSKNVGQVKYSAEILNKLSPAELEKTALVLADENLLLPVINSLPPNIKAVNITMGVPLKSLPALIFFENLLQLHQDNNDTFYYKDIQQLLNHFLGKILMPLSSENINRAITERNLTYIDLNQLISIADGNDLEIIKLLFATRENSIEKSISAFKDVLYILKDKKQVRDNPILLETIFKIYQTWNKLEGLNKTYHHLTSAKSLYLLFRELAATTNLDFKGEPYKGLQIMGILETRALDFENIIILSVNEGILPAGKSNRSFITYDLKKQYKLPTHKEKDAIYTYHFYRLLHRAKKIHLIYNNHSSGIQVGEKSRFLLQLQYDDHPAHNIKELFVSPKMELQPLKLKSVSKTPEIIEELKSIALRGLSPSALTTYIRDPMDFYTRYILKIKDNEEVEETVAMNTLGTVIHDTLEILYKPYIGQFLKIKDIEKMFLLADAEVASQFSKTFREGNITSGKNLLIFEIAKKFVNSLLEMDKQNLKNNKIQIKSIEDNLKTEVSIPELDFPVFITGKVDRIDIVNGSIRIIDYKTGKVNKGDLGIMDWDLLTTEYKYSKTFQILAYTLISNAHERILPAEAGIISFKNLKEGFMPFHKKDKPRGPADTLLSEETLEQYTIQLKNLILEICDPAIPFTEKEV